jgi:hypothetical protein
LGKRTRARLIGVGAAALLAAGFAAASAFANTVSYGGQVNGHKRVLVSFDLIGAHCPKGPHCFDHAKVTKFGAVNFGYPGCPNLLEGGFEYGNPDTTKPTAVKVNGRLSFGGQGRADDDFIIRVAFHGQFLKHGAKATGWFEVHNGPCSTGKLNWTATPGG